MLEQQKKGRIFSEKEKELEKKNQEMIEALEKKKILKIKLKMKLINLKKNNQKKKKKLEEQIKKEEEAMEDFKINLKN